VGRGPRITPPPDLGVWLVENQVATRVDGGLVPTAKTRELVDAFD